MKNWLKKITGITKLEEEKARLEEEKIKADEEARISVENAEKLRKEEELAKMTPKERATANNEPWVAVLDTKVNPENPRNGFFELDWNTIFVEHLIKAGYGYENDPEEEIVDRWFRDLARNILAEEGQDVNRGAGYINVVPISKGKSEVS